MPPAAVRWRSSTPRTSIVPAGRTWESTAICTRRWRPGRPWSTPSGGAEIHPELTPLPGEPVIKKHRYNSFYATDLEIILRGLGVETVILTGMTTECCVLGTARGALERGFRSVVISDACASCDYPDLGAGPMSAADMHLAALRVMSLTSSQLVGTDEFLSWLP